MDAGKLRSERRIGRCAGEAHNTAQAKVSPFFIKLAAIADLEIIERDPVTGLSLQIFNRPLVQKNFVVFKRRSECSIGDGELQRAERRAGSRIQS